MSSLTTSSPLALTRDSFIEKVFDYTNATEWEYKGTVPAVIDFWAEWCGPCKAVAPVFEELAKEFEGKVQFYKVDTEAEQELAEVFGIQSIPSFLFIPVGDKPQMATGALPKEVFQNVIRQELLGEVVEDNEDDEQESWGIIENTELREWLDSNEELPILLDVRNPDEHAEKNIPNSILIPLSELEIRVHELEQYKDQQLVVYCRSGGRSARACEFLSGKGYSALNLEGGMLAW